MCENWGESDREGRIDNDAAFSMSYIRGEDREQASFLPARIDDYVGAEAAVQVIDAFAEGLDVVGLGFVRAVPAATGRPGYDPRKRDPIAGVSRFRTARRGGASRTFPTELSDFRRVCVGNRKILLQRKF